MSTRQTYLCGSFGECSHAGQAFVTDSPVAPLCSGCGKLMKPQGRKRTGGAPSSLVRWAAVGLLLLLLVPLVRSLGHVAVRAVSGPRTEQAIDGVWHIENTSLLGAGIAIGPALEFHPDSAMVMGKSVQVSEYSWDGDTVRLLLPTSGGLETSLSFRLEDDDHLVIDGPLGIQARYRRGHRPS